MRSPRSGRRRTDWFMWAEGVPLSQIRGVLRTVRGRSGSGIRIGIRRAQVSVVTAEDLKVLYEADLSRGGPGT